LRAAYPFSGRGRELAAGVIDKKRVPSVNFNVAFIWRQCSEPSNSSVAWKGVTAERAGSDDLLEHAAIPF